MPEPLWTSAEIVAATGGRLVGEAFAATGVAIDSRALVAGDLFVALPAERDGHDFVDAARAAGAAGALATRDVGAPCIVVDDTLAALGRLGEAARRRAPACARGAVTGSVGKTSVTQLVRAGLELAAQAGQGAAHGSIRSFNNHIGVPLTLARMPRDSRRAIFEIGMNHAGEIAPLTRLVAPRAAAITNVEAVHVENFADGETGVMRAKAEIFEGLEPKGIAILNGDSRWFEDLKRIALDQGARVRVFGRAEGADAHLTGFSTTDAGAAVEAWIDGERAAFSIRQSAAHWGPMSLCALLMMRALDVDLGMGLAALAAFEPLSGRGAERAVDLSGGRLTIIDESYNASPVSMRAALKALGARKVGGRRIAALTDMLELGPESPDRHAELARVIEAANIDRVFCAGPLMEALWDALPPARRGGWAPAAADLAPALATAVLPGDVIMAKGSHASNARAFIDALIALGAPETHAP